MTAYFRQDFVECAKPNRIVEWDGKMMRTVQLCCQTNMAT